MFEIVVVSFQEEDKLGRAQFFQETFLLADFSIKVVLKKRFSISSNANILFAK